MSRSISKMEHCKITWVESWTHFGIGVGLKILYNFRATLKQLEKKYGSQLRGSDVVKVCELADHSVTCIKYDVSSQAVSIHLPLTRLIAGLHLLLEKFDLTYDSPEFSVSSKLTPTELIEPVLRTQVLIAQVGYHNIKWNKYRMPLFHGPR